MKKLTWIFLAAIGYALLNQHHHKTTVVKENNVKVENDPPVFFHPASFVVSGSSLVH